MRTITTLLAIAAFALHLLLGCCWHHAHGADELSEHHHASHGCNHVHLPSWLCPTAASHGDHQHHEHEHDGSGDSDTTPHPPCSDPLCVYLISGQVALPAPSDLALPVAFVDLQTANAAAIVSVAAGAPHDKFSLHVRRHHALCQFLN